jgi:hypothetical protein
MRSNAYLPASKVGKFPQNAIDAKSQPGLYLGTHPDRRPANRTLGPRKRKSRQPQPLVSNRTLPKGDRKDRKTGKARVAARVKDRVAKEWCARSGVQSLHPLNRAPARAGSRPSHMVLGYSPSSTHRVVTSSQLGGEGVGGVGGVGKLGLLH